MGASTSVVVALLFLGFLIAATATYSSVDYYQNLIKRAQEDQDSMNKNKMQTDIAVINITKSPSLNITLKNTGKTTLNSSLLEIFVNGTYYSSYNQSTTGNTWPPMNKTNITIPVSAASGNRIKIVTENGISDYALVP